MDKTNEHPQSSENQPIDDLTQKEVGQIINKSQQGYSHIEDGRAELKIDDLIKLCKFYGVSADYFIGISEKKK